MSHYDRCPQCGEMGGIGGRCINSFCPADKTNYRKPEDDVPKELRYDPCPVHGYYSECDNNCTNYKGEKPMVGPEAIKPEVYAEEVEQESPKQKYILVTGAADEMFAAKCSVAIENGYMPYGQWAHVNGVFTQAFLLKGVFPNVKKKFYNKKGNNNG